MRPWLLIVVLSGCAVAQDGEAGSVTRALAATPDEVFPAVGVHAVPASRDQLVPLPLHHIEMTRVGLAFVLGTTADADGAIYPSYLDPIIRTYAESGVWVLPTVSGVPPEVLANLPAWERFNETLAQRYGPQGSFWVENPGIEPRPIRIWEVYNEPNLPLFWGAEPNPHHYRRMLRHAFIGLRRGDPRARVMLAAIVFTQGNGTAWRPYLRTVLDGPSEEVRRNNQCLFDAVAVHPYAETVNGTIREMTKLRRVLEEERVIGDGPDRDVQMWVTEIGWGLEDVCEAAEPDRRCRKFVVANATAQERRMRHEIDALQDRAGRFRLGAITWYTFQDLDPSTCTGKQAWWCHAGLWTEDMSLQRPGWAALGQAAQARGMRRLPPVRCSYDAAGLEALAADDATDGGGFVITRILVLASFLAGCDGVTPEASAAFEVDSLSPHCAEAACGLDDPLMRGAELDVLVRFDDASLTAPFGAESSDRGVFVITGSESHPPEDENAPLTHTVGIRAVGVGSATLRLVAEGGRTVTSSQVRVEDPAALAIELGPEAMRDAEGVPEIEVGDTLLLIATATAGDGRPMHTGSDVTWAIRSGGAVLATDDGPATNATDEAIYLSALGEGVATVSATSGPTSATATVRIVAEPPL